MRQKMSVNQRAFEDRKEKTRHKVNDGDNIFRILPPFGDESEGYPYKRWTLTWLHDPQTGNKRPFASLWSFGHKDCPAAEYTKLLQDKREALENQLLSNGKTKEQVKEALAPISETLYEMKPKSTFFYNAVNKSGQVGILELKKSAHDALKKVFRQYITDYGFDPTSLNSDHTDSGVWVKITRTGQRMDTEYSVDKNQMRVKDPETGKVRFEDDQGELPANVVENYDSLATNLFSLYREISYSDLKEVVLFNVAKMHDMLTDTYGKEAADLILVPGFKPESLEKHAETKAAPKAVAAVAKKAPVLRMDDDEDDDVPPAAKTKPLKSYSPPFDPDEPVVQTKKGSNKSVFDLADDILS